MKKKYKTIFIVFTIILGACENKGDYFSRSEMDALKAQVDTLEKSLEAAEIEIIKMDWNKDKYSSAIFSPQEEGFSRIDTSLGTFLISISNIKPYANGYAVTFNVGNPSFAAYQEVSLSVEWGKEIKGMKYPEWKKQLRSTTKKLNKKLGPGKWNKVTVRLVPASKEEISHIKVIMDTPGISLGK